MADNKPLGYVGYYPGERPVYKNYGGQVEPLPDMSYLDPLNDAMRQIDNFVNYNLDIPKKLKDFYVDDLMNSLRVSVSVKPSDKNITEEELARYGSEAFQNMQGVGVAINLDPRKWAEDPKGMAWKTLKGFVEGMVDPTDFSNLVDAANMETLLSDTNNRRSVDDLTSGGVRRLFDKADVNSENALLSKMEANIRRNFDGDLPAENPFSLDTSSGAYDATKAAFINLQYNSNSFIGREGAYDKAIQTSANAMLQDVVLGIAADRGLRASDDQLHEGRMRFDSIDYFEKVGFDEELRQMIASGASDSAIQRRIDSMSSIAQGSLNNVDSNLLRDQADRMVFELRRDNSANIIEKMRNDHVAQYANVTTAQDFADKYKFGKAFEDDHTLWFSDEFQGELRHKLASTSGLNPANIDAHLEHMNTFFVQTELANSFSSIDSSLGKLNTALNKRALGADNGEDIAKSLSALDSQYAAFAEGGKLDDLLSRLPDKKRKEYTELLGEYRKDGRVWKGAESTLGSSLSDLKKRVVTSEGGTSIVNLSLNEAGNFRNRFSNVKSGGLFGSGLGGRDLFKRGAKNRVLRDMSEEWWKYGDQAKVLGAMTEKGNSIFALFPLLEEQRAQGFWDEFFRQMEKGKLLDTFVLSRVKDKFKYYTPSYWVEHALSKSHYFGLKMDDGALKKATGGFWYNQFTRKDGLAKGAHAHNFGISFDLGGRSHKMKMQGGDHLKFVDSMKGHLIGEKGKFQFSDSQLKKLLSAKNGDEFSKIAHGLASGMSASDIKNLEKQFDTFKDFFRRHHKFIGIPADKIDDPEMMFQVFQGIHQRGLHLDRIGVSKVSGLTTKYMGGLQKLHLKLNHAQTLLYERFGHIIRPFVNIKSRITNKIMASVALKKVLTRLAVKLTDTLGATLGGVGAFLGEALEPLIRYVVGKVVDFGEKFLKSALKGDVVKVFQELFESVGKTFTWAIKTTIAILAVPLVFFGLIIMLFGAVLGGISPVNPTQIGGGEYMSGNMIPGGNVARPYQPCSVPTKPANDCFFLQGNTGSAGSYNPAGQTSTGGGRGHGSNNYWNIVGDVCNFNIPTQTSGFPARGSTVTTAGNSASYCFNKTPKNEYYGFAADYPPVGCGTIYFPNIAQSWTIVETGFATFGSMAISTGYAGPNGTGGERYKMILLHLAPGGVYETNTSSQNRYASPGDRASELADWGGRTHLHVELLEWNTNNGNWVPRRPEEVVCKGTAF